MVAGEMVYSQSRSSLDIDNFSKINTTVTAVVARLIKHLIDLLNRVVKRLEFLENFFTESRGLCG